MELDAIQRLTTGLKWMTREKADRFSQLIHNNHILSCLEVGTFQGVGTCYLAAILEPLNGSVVTVDLAWSVLLEPNAESVISRCGLKNVTLLRHVDGVHGVLRETALPQFDLIYHDAGHVWSKAVVPPPYGPEEIYRVVLPLLRPGGFLVVDDIHSHAETRLFWNEVVLKDPTFRFHLEYDCNMGVAGKVKP